MELCEEGDLYSALGCDKVVWGPQCAPCLCESNVAVCPDHPHISLQGIGHSTGYSPGAELPPQTADCASRPQVRHHGLICLQIAYCCRLGPDTAGAPIFC